MFPQGVDMHVHIIIISTQMSSCLLLGRFFASNASCCAITAVFRSAREKISEVVWSISSIRLSRGVARSKRYAVIVRPLRVLVVDVGIFCGNIPCTFFKTGILERRASSHVRSSLHLLPTLENMTLRHFDSNLQRQVSLHFLS